MQHDNFSCFLSRRTRETNKFATPVLASVCSSAETVVFHRVVAASSNNNDLMLNDFYAYRRVCTLSYAVRSLTLDRKLTNHSRI